MNFSRESALALQRHYLGALSTPAATWLEPLPAARLAFAGAAVRVDHDGCLVDFGTVDVARDQKCIVRVFLPGRQRIDVRTAASPAWLATEWSGDPSSLLALHVTADAEGERVGVLSLAMLDGRGTRTETLRVRIVGAPRQPSAAITFNGTLAPRAFAFETDDATYTIAVANRNSVPLVVSLSDLPEWLEMTVDGCTRSGPLPGRFFERTAPFTITLRPRLLGRHEGVLRMQSNDRSAELRDLTLPLSADLAPLRPHLRVIPSAPVASSRKRLIAHTRLENWGRSPARIRVSTTTGAVTVPERMHVAAASQGRPGRANLPIRIAASQLEQGTHLVLVTLQVEGGEPAQATVPVQVNVTAAAADTPRLFRPATFMAIVALLLLTIALLSAARYWS